MTPLQPVNESRLNLLRQAFQTKDEKLLAEIRKHSAEILGQLDRAAEIDSHAPSAIELGHVSPEWIALVYRALSGIADADAQAIEDEPTVRELLETRTQWEASIGKAFAEALLPEWLRPDLRDIKAWFGSLPDASTAQQAHLRQSAAVQAGGPYALELCQYGLTPLSVYRGIHSVYLFVDRLIDYGHLQPHKPILLDISPGREVEMSSQRLDPAGVITGIAEYANCSGAAAERLCNWEIQLGQYHPHLFYGLEAHPCGANGVSLKVAPHAATDNVYKRWSVQAAGRVSAQAW